MLLQHLLAISPWLASALAQNSTNSTTPGHDPELNTLVNATGSVAFRSRTSASDQDWYISVTYRDENASDIVHRGLQNFISVPNDTTSQACVYVFGAPGPAQGNGNNGCDGVLSQECISFLSNNIRLATSGGTGDIPCPALPALDEISRACGDGFEKRNFIYSGEASRLCRYIYGHGC